MPAGSVPLHKHLHAIAFGFADAQVDLAPAEIEKGSSLPSRKRRKCRAELHLHQYLSPSLLGHLPRDGHLDDRGLGSWSLSNNTFWRVTYVVMSAQGGGI